MFYAYLYSLFCVIVAIVSIKRFKQILNPVTVFCGIWAVLFFLSGLKLYGVYTAEASTYSILFSGVFSFVLGHTMGYLLRKKYVISLSSKKSCVGDYELRYEMLYFLSFICIIFFGMQLIKVAGVLLNDNSLAAIRELAQADSEYSTGGSKVLNALRILIIIPSSVALVPLTAIDYWFGRKDKKLVWMCIIIILLRIFSEGGRILIVYLALHLLIGYSYYRRTRNSKSLIDLKSIRKNKKRVRLIIGVLGIFLIWATFSRTTSNLFHTLYYYFSMQPFMFETWAREAETRNLLGLGTASFNGFIFPVLYILKNMLGVPLPAHFESVYQLILDTNSNWQFITEHAVRANAYVSNFWTPYVDGRIFGVLFISLLYGIFGGYLLAATRKNTNKKSICLFSFYMQGVLLSFSGFAFSGLYYCIAYFVIALAFKRKRKSNYFT